MTGIYRSHEGTTVAVLGVARDPEGERHVLYFALREGTLHVCPFPVFHGPTVYPDGKSRPRFQLVSA